MTRSLARVALVVALLLAPVSNLAAQPAVGAPGEAAIRAFLATFIDALCTADAERLVALFTPDATVFFPLPQVPLRLEDRAEVSKAFGAFFEGVRRQQTGPRYMNLVPEDVKIQQWGDAALVTFHFKGSAMISRRTLVLRRSGGAWLAVHLHASNQRIGEP